MLQQLYFIMFCIIFLFQLKNKKVLQYPRILELNDDFSLIKSFIEGDESTFKILVQRHKEKVRNIIYLTLNNTASVDDIAQDVFVTVYKNLKKFRFESQFTTWLYRITINKCKDHIRKMKIRIIATFMEWDVKDENKPLPHPNRKNTYASELVIKLNIRLKR